MGMADDEKIAELEERIELIEQHLLAKSDAKDPTRDGDGEATRSFRLKLEELKDD